MNTAKFVTVTPSPLFERTVVTKYLAVGYRNQAVRPERLDPSGQGVNIARALHALECETHAVVLLGNDLTGRAYRALVMEEGFDVTSVPVDGSTPSQTSILDIGRDQETTIASEEAQITGADLQRLAMALEATVTAEDTVVFAGLLPPKAPDDTFARLIEAVHELGAEAILITEGPALREALAAQPEMLALSQLQCESFFNVPIRVQEDLLTTGRRLRELGAGRVLLELQDSAGAILVTEEGQWEVTFPQAAVGTTSGIWEALVAGFLAGRCRQVPLERSLEMAGTAAAYAAGEVGVGFGSPSDVEAYHADVEVRSLDENQGLEDPAAG